jgi:transcriptional regulator with XRE-family HTH domain
MRTKVNRKQQSISPTVQGAVVPLRLVRLGARLAALRKQKNWKQKEVADQLADAHGRSISQSLVAQIENGKMTNPDAELLRDLAKVYGGQYDELVADIVADKYGISPFKALLLARDILDVPGLAQWERDLPRGSHLWIAAPNFVDDKNKEMRDVVIELQQRGGTVVYFVDARDTGPGRKFETLRSEFAQDPRLRDVSKPLWRELKPDEVAILSTSFVIANPGSAFGDNPQAIGYQIVNGPDGAPEFGVRMALADLQPRVTLLNSFQKELPFKPMVVE